MPNDATRIDAAPATGRCPHCGKPTVFETRPFCSRRCADVDLGLWLTGAYAIPVMDGIDDTDIDRSDEAL